jgi:toxin ParE1/3/4
MKLRFTRRATQDIASIADYIRERNPAAAARVRAAIYESIENLILFPQAGRRQKTEAVRKIVTRRYRYFVYYTVDQDREEIIVLSVKHSAQRREYDDT